MATGRHNFSHFLTQGFTGWTRPKPRTQRVSLGLTGYIPKHAKPEGYSRTFGPIRVRRR